MNEFQKTLLVAAASQAVGSRLDRGLVNNREFVLRVFVVCVWICASFRFVIVGLHLFDS